MQTFRDVSCLFGMFRSVFWSCFYQPPREPGELVLKRWSSFATTLYTEDLLNIACCLKHLEWHLIVSPLMIHCIAIQTHSFKRLYCNHSIVKPAMFINEGIRDACSTEDIFNGCSSGFLVVTKWTPSSLLVVYWWSIGGLLMVYLRSTN